jgi:hypothetical protein
MKDIREVLRRKEQELLACRRDVAAIRWTLRLIREANDPEPPPNSSVDLREMLIEGEQQ